MSFTDDEKSQIRGYLGYPDLFLYEFTLLENAMIEVGTNPSAVIIVQTLLSDLANVELALAGIAVDVAGLEGAGKGEISFFEGGKISDLKRIGRTLCNKLSIKFRTPIRDDYFGINGAETSAGLMSVGFF